MNEREEVVLEAAARGRLIFPYMEELTRLREERKIGPLTATEKERLAGLEEVFKEFSGLDRSFHAAMASGDLTTAERAAYQALTLLGLTPDAGTPEEAAP